MEHTCGIIIKGLKQKDAGTWQCHLDYENEDTGQTENEVQEFTFGVARSPSPGSGQLCRGQETDSGEGEMDLKRCHYLVLFLSDGTKSIRKGLLAKQIYDWFQLGSLSFDFKITGNEKRRRRRRRTQSVALVTAERGKRRCCSAEKAILGVWIGKKVGTQLRTSMIYVSRQETNDVHDLWKRQ